MFEQENLQGWNISHIVSSWHRGLGKANTAIPPHSAFQHRVGNPGKAQGEGDTGGTGRPLRGVSLFPVKENEI